MSNLTIVHHFQKTDETGQVVGAYVLVRDSSNGDQFSAELSGDFRTATAEAIIDEVLESVFNRYYADKVMLESVAKMEEVIKAFEAFKAEQAQVKARQEEVNGRLFAELAAVKKAKGKPPVPHEVVIEE